MFFYRSTNGMARSVATSRALPIAWCRPILILKKCRRLKKGGGNIGKYVIKIGLVPSGLKHILINDHHAPTTTFFFDRHR
jgi:hypothetical protein